MTDENTPTSLEKMHWDEAKEIYRAWHEGGKLELFILGKGWTKRINDGEFPSGGCAYRVAPRRPSVDWSHVADWINYIATDADGMIWAYWDKPIKMEQTWNCLSLAAFMIINGPGGKCLLASYDPGDCDWTKSLIVRPGQED